MYIRACLLLYMLASPLNAQIQFYCVRQYDSKPFSYIQLLKFLYEVKEEIGIETEQQGCIEFNFNYERIKNV